MSDNSLLYRIALSNLPGIGDITARRLLDHLGSPEAVFNEPYRNLIKIPGIGSTIAGYIRNNNSIERAKKEIEFIQKHDISTAFFTDKNYPYRLGECADSPILLFYKGDMQLKSQKVLSVIGTRNATIRGRELCSSIIGNLALQHPDLVIVSGLAYGIDIAAHKAALKADISTIGVMAHGFATLYPSVHTGVAIKMLDRGALICDFLSDEPPDRNNFLKRNRIIAGIADATLVVESGLTGGAMVTADIALSYSRDLFAIPGSPGDKQSSGCNLLIKSNRASLVEKSEDIEYFLGWEKARIETDQKRLPDNLSPLEKDIFKLISIQEKISADSLSEMLKTPLHSLSSALLSLEFSGLIRSIPGNYYKLSSL